MSSGILQSGQSNFKIRFDRNELAGAFGDMGTDVPILIGVILAAGLNSANVLVVFGLMQIINGVIYKMPMPVQPLKAMAAIVITQQISPSAIYGAGIAIGALMLLLAFSGLLDWLARAIPKCVVRGIQFGLGLQLASVALTKYVQSDGGIGIALAAIAFLISIILLNNRKLPAALPVVVLGILYAIVFKPDTEKMFGSVVSGFIPQFAPIKLADIFAGLIILALPQLPLSIGNSILATAQISNDLFPERKITVKKIGITYGLMNLIAPLFGGFPVCHGSGGLIGHYTFGGRTGGSVIIYGFVFLIIGGLLGDISSRVINMFPLSVLGVLLLFESIGLIYLCKDVALEKREFSTTILVGLISALLPYGFVIGIVIGTAIFYFKDNIHLTAKH